MGDGVLLHPPFGRVAPRHCRTVGRPWSIHHAALFDLLGLLVGRRGARPGSRRGRGRGGLELEPAQQVRASDFHACDLLAVAPDADARSKVLLLRELDPQSVAIGATDVPDPYHGGPDGFDIVLDVVEAGCRGRLRADGLIQAGPDLGAC